MRFGLILELGRIFVLRLSNGFFVSYLREVGELGFVDGYLCLRIVDNYKLSYCDIFLVFKVNFV